MRARRALAAAGASLAIVGGCGEGEPVAVPEKPTHAFDYSILPDGRIDGAVTDYDELTLDEAAAMEQCHTNTSRVLLTFDDSGDPEHVEAIVRTLEEHNVGGLFFPNTNRVTDETIDDLRQRGFWVANHTYSHPDITELTDEEIEEEILKGTDSNLVRPPYGALGRNENGETFFDHRIRRIAHQLGKNICMWTVNSKDYDGRSAEAINARVLSEVRMGSVVLMHMDNDNNNTLEALPAMIAGIREKGLELCEPSAQPTTGEIPSPLPCDE